ncbi:glycosyltransferase family 4 protein, partial [Neobacillus niacini]|uniref:glycosyltransferase family 4 protein n=1 Tax=Neobacillus niacini TaxID=86668 RepID=UPI002FFFB848
MKIALITNILTPYRSFFYEKLNNYLVSQNIDFKVFVMAETESNRNWKYDEYKTSFTELMGYINLGKKDFYINKRIKKSFVSFSPDLVVAAGGYHLPTIWRLLSLKKKVKFKLLFWSESNLVKKENLKGMKITLRENLRKITYQNFDGFWYSGKLSKEFIEKYTAPDKEMYFLPNLVDNNLYSSVPNTNKENLDEIMTNYNLSRTKRIFLCPARLSKQKGILEFLSLFKQCGNAEDATILLAGNGELKDKINNVIEENKQLDIRLLGFKTQNEMLKLYAVSDFFLLPSVEDPNPLTCIEALWCGLPLLITEHVGNYPEVLIQEKNGFLINYKNTENAIRQIEKAIASDQEWLNSAKLTSKQIANNLYEPKNAISNCIDEMI